MTNLQRILIDRLRLEFGLDTAPAELLAGAELDAWIHEAEDRLFEDLIQSLNSPAAG